jgi:hypothetical protein
VKVRHLSLVSRFAEDRRPELNRGRGAAATLCEALAVAIQRNHVGAVDEPVDQCGGDHGSGETAALLWDSRNRTDVSDTRRVTRLALVADWSSPCL